MPREHQAFHICSQECRGGSRGHDGNHTDHTVTACSAGMAGLLPLICSLCLQAWDRTQHAGRVEITVYGDQSCVSDICCTLGTAEHLTWGWGPPSCPGHWHEAAPPITVSRVLSHPDFSKEAPFGSCHSQTVPDLLPPRLLPAAPPLPCRPAA